MIDLLPNSHTRNRGLETQTRDYGIKVMNDLPKTFPKKVLFTQRLGMFGKNGTKLSYPNIDKQIIYGSISINFVKKNQSQNN